MSLFFGKVITATVTGRRLQSLKCERCGTSFYYVLTRVGIGKGSAPYYLGQEGATKRAAAAAEKNLATRLSDESELVPCPKCNWVNQDLVERYRRRHYRRAPLLIFLLIIVGLVVAPLIGGGFSGDIRSHSHSASRHVLDAIIAILLTSPAWVLFIRRQFRLRIDPNATYPRRPALPPGTPPALQEHRDPQSGESCLLPVTTQSDEPRNQPLWALFRPGQIRMPPICCRCLAPATVVYQSPLKVNDGSEISVPLCGPCRKRLRVHWWLTILLVTAISFAIASVLALVVTGGDPIGRTIVFAILASFASLIGGVVTAAIVVRPYRLAVVDRDRGIVRFAAANPEFTALLVDQVRRSDGIVAR